MALFSRGPKAGKLKLHPSGALLLAQHQMNTKALAHAALVLSWGQPTGALLTVRNASAETSVWAHYIAKVPLHPPAPRQGLPLYRRRQGSVVPTHSTPRATPLSATPRFHWGARAYPRAAAGAAVGATTSTTCLGVWGREGGGGCPTAIQEPPYPKRQPAPFSRDHRGTVTGASLGPSHLPTRRTPSPSPRTARCAS